MNTLKHREDGRAGNHLGAVRLKTGWQTTQLSAVATVLSGAGFPDRYQGQSEGPIPFYKVSDMNIAGNQREMVFDNNSITEEARRELRAFLFPRGSTIFPKIGGAIATNKKRLTIRDCCVDNNVMGVIPKPGHINSEFLFYFFLAHDLSEFANEAHLPSIRKTVVEAWPINLPVSLAEQQRIVAILDAAFEGIATARANAVKNLENARALFESHLEAVFSNRGEGWVEKWLEEVCNLLPGYAFKSADYINAPNTLNIRMSNIRPSGSFDSEHNQKFLPDSYAKKYSAYSLYEGDLIIAMTDMAGDPKFLGVPTLVRNLNSRNFLTNQRVGKLFDFTPDVCQRYLRYFLTSPSVKKYYKTKGADGLQINISKGDILSVVVPLPNVEHQDCVTEQLDALRDETNRLCDIYTQKIAALDALKKSLLHQAFSGEL